MNSLDIEREIVEKYVKKHKQERILWELTNAKKRDAVIWKFAGTNIFKDNCLQKTEYISEKEYESMLQDCEEIRKMLISIIITSKKSS